MKGLTSNRRRLLGGIILACGFLAAPGFSFAQTQDTIKIGLLLSITGPAATYGIPARDAIQVVADDINAKGGVNGRKIELVVYDEATNPTESARGIVELIQRDKVVAVVGSSMGSGTLAAGPMAARFQVPMLAPNGTISVTSKDNAFHPWVFRAMTSDALNTKVMFERATASGAKRLAIMHQEDAYGKETADYIERLAKEKGIEVVTVASAPMRAIDLVAQATKVRNAEPDVVLMQIGPVGLATGFLRAAKQVGIKAPLWGGMGLGYNAFIQIGGDAAEGARLVVVGNFDDPSPGLKELGALLQKAGKKPEGWAEVIGTNGLLAIVEAAKQVKGPISGAAIRDQLEKLCGVTNYSQGKVCYSADNHDGYGSDLLLGVEVRNGKFNVVN